MAAGPTCYCGAAMELRQSQYGPFWRCVNPATCDGSIGVHRGTTTPLGIPANAETRRARIRAHEAFDGLWRGRSREARNKAYAWLAGQLGIERAACHIAMFDVTTCGRVLEVCRAEYNRRREVADGKGLPGTAEPYWRRG